METDACSHVTLASDVWFQRAVQQQPDGPRVAADFWAMTRTFESLPRDGAGAPGTETWETAWRLDPTDRRPPDAFRDVGDMQALRDMFAMSGHPDFGPAALTALQRSDPSGWSAWRWRARRDAAVWRFCVQAGLDGTYRRLIADIDVCGWGELSNDGITKAMDGVVENVDATVDVLQRLCVLPIAVEHGGLAWVGGLSRSGNLVGAMSSFVQQ